MNLALKRAEIVKKLLTGATQIDSKINRNIRVFMKPDSFQSAFDEFKLLKPINVEKSHKYHWHSNVISGNVEDRFIVIERKGMSILREKYGVPS